MTTQMAETSGPISVESALLESAYATCREIARREAKNFYFSFIALPKARRDAICAIYAFMRKADDLSDDESITREERRRQLILWISEWHEARQGFSTADPVFLAVRDATLRFHIPFSLLDDLVAGTTMDLDEHSASGPDTYETFADLYRYCYLVASVVGLVCIRIFGYTDPRAEKLAEETGIAFQLTNILRDVKEDADRGRIYLPLDELARDGVSIDQLVHRRTKGVTDSERKALQAMAQRAEVYYQSAQQLLPLIDRESRPALWVLVEIYHQLLKRIERSNYDVFSKRARVPTLQKLSILSIGLFRMGLARVAGRLSLI